MKFLAIGMALFTFSESVLSVTLFEKESIYQALSNVSHTNQEGHLSNQANLFD
jgi:hypothetical protein